MCFEFRQTVCLSYEEMENVDGGVDLYFEALHISFHRLEIFCVLYLGYTLCP